MPDLPKYLEPPDIAMMNAGAEILDFAEGSHLEYKRTPIPVGSMLADDIFSLTELWTEKLAACENPCYAKGREDTLRVLLHILEHVPLRR